jgi:hypothetical protein
VRTTRPSEPAPRRPAGSTPGRRRRDVPRIGLELPQELVDDLTDAHLQWQVEHPEWRRVHGKVSMTRWLEGVLRYGIAQLSDDDPDRREEAADEIGRMIRPDARRRNPA